MTARRTAAPRVRLYETLRTAHLERAHELARATILYRERRYDFDASTARGLDLVRCGTLGAVRVLLRSDVRELEVNEPLMISSLRRTAPVVVALAWRAALLRRPLTISTYAIANDDPFRAPPRAGVRGRVRRGLDRVLLNVVASRIDRVVYGTSAAQDLYRQLVPGVVHAESVLVPALPAPCGCGRGDESDPDPDPDPDQVLFVGAFEPRKGIRALLEAWPGVVDEHPTAHLTVVGKGPLRPEVEAFADTRRDVTVVVDPERSEIHRRLRGAALVVLLSQRTERWREQVGLPLVEGLSHGCSVLTTTESGLADWLAGHGHGVIGTAVGPDEVAAAVVRLLAERRSAQSVLADLPDQDGRLLADAWMFPDDRSGPGGSGTTGREVTG